MDLKTYFLTNSQADLAKAVGVTAGAVNQWVSGATKPSAERCLQIERVTGGFVRCEDLRPDLDWAVVRNRPRRSALVRHQSPVNSALAGV